VGHYSRVIYWRVLQVETTLKCRATTKGKTPPAAPRKSDHFTGSLRLQDLHCGKPSGLNYSQCRRTPVENSTGILRSPSSIVAKCPSSVRWRRRPSKSSRKVHRFKRLLHDKPLESLTLHCYLSYRRHPTCTLGSSRQRFKSSPTKFKPRR